MGLDSYLNAVKYVSGYDFNEADEKKQYQSLIEAAGMKDIAAPFTPSAEISCTVMYLRKANAIHAFFVREVQEGVDECQKSYVPIEKLIDLYGTCKYLMAAKNNPNVSDEEANALAVEHLPPQSGFFFGSTEVDEWYWGDIEDTIKQLDRVLDAAKENPQAFSFEYYASW